MVNVEKKDTLEGKLADGAWAGKYRLSTCMSVKDLLSCGLLRSQKCCARISGVVGD
jgi:hypothetical protein